MDTFICQHCNQATFFENSQCESCGALLGFDSDHLALISLTLNSQDQTLSDTQSNTYKACANRHHGVCNWLLSKHASEGDSYCLACSLNRYIPNLSDTESAEQWASLEQAKKRLVYSLMRFKLPVVTKNQAGSDGLSFDFIDQQQSVPVDAADTTGHAQGQITITTDEANPSEREQTRVDMGEKYRTLLGHFRHEIGHYYWDQLIADDEQWLLDFRQVFGDESQNYQTALANHYQAPNLNWKSKFISQYASAHPWEDWAETWAHYFHLIDTIDTAINFGLSLTPINASLPRTSFLPLNNSGEENGNSEGVNPDAYAASDFRSLYDNYIPITLAVNSLNRSLGQSDFYPFVLSESVFKKLDFIHRLIKNKSAANEPLNSL